MAVLPFKSLRPDPETDFLGFSLTDQVITKLNYIKSVVVRPSDAVRKYEKVTIELPQVAKDLDVEVILTGSYLKSGDRFRLTAQLVDVPKNQVLWSEPVEVQYADLFSLQDVISQKIIDGLKLHLSTEEHSRLKAGISSNPVAYEYFLKATGLPQKTSADLALKIKLMDQSIQLDSTYAPAWAARGTWYITYGQEVGNADRYFEHAEQDVKRALDIDPDNIPALSRLASLYAEIGRINEAIPLLRKGLSVSPNDPIFQSQLGYIVRYAGMLDESIKAYQKAALVDSSVLSLVGRQNQISKAYIYKGDYRNALLSAKTIQSALESSQLSVNPQVLFYLGLPSYLEKDYPTAFRLFDSCAVVDPTNSWTLFGQAYKAAVTGNRGRVVDVIKKLEERKIADAEMFYRFTHLYLFVDDDERALNSLKVAIKGGFICYPYLANDPLTEKLRSRKEFQDLLQEAKTRHEEFKQKFTMNL
jgi:TolB-like protein